jgi:hypothetical protein
MITATLLPLFARRYTAAPPPRFRAPVPLPLSPPRTLAERAAARLFYAMSAPPDAGFSAATPPRAPPITGHFFIQIFQIDTLHYDTLSRH